VFFRRAAKPDVQLLVVGLGNPGQRYSATRHNAGWWVLDELARRAGKVRTAARHHGQVDYCKIEGLAAALVKPATFMNLSGQCVAAWVREFPAAQLLVVFDDIALPVGRLRLREEGSSGGHRGAQSIIDALRRDDFMRLRIGVGQAPEGMDAADYVLAEPSASERKLLGEATARAADVVSALARGGYDEALRAAN